MLGVTGPVMSLGLITVYGVGDIVNWRWVAASSALIPVITALSLWYLTVCHRRILVVFNYRVKLDP